MEREKIRLQKYLADYGVASRRAAEKMIAEGRVTVNGSIVDAMGVKVDPEQDKIAVDGRQVESKPQPCYLLMFKPAGYICSAHDERKRRTVLDLLTGVSERVYPVGRLDYNTSGLLLLTNDGELTNKLIHPSHQVAKTYLAEVEGVPDAHALRCLREGVRLEDGVTAPAQVRIRSRRQDNALVELQIHEGRNRQVRRMMDAVGHPVRHLRRTGLAFLNLQGLKAGEWRRLTAEEVQRLKQL